MKINYEQLDNAAANGGDLVENLGNGARAKVCEMYHDYKDWYNNNVGLNTPSGALLEHYWNKLCPLEPPYEVPPPPFTGGQCSQVLYSLKVRKINIETGQLVQDGSYRVYAPIIGIRIFPPDQFSPLTRTFLVSTKYEGGEDFNALDSSSDGVVFRYEIHSISRLDGQPDNCGNPPTTNPPVLSPPNQIDDIITTPDGIDFPITISPKIELPGLNVNTIIPIFRPEFDFNLNPQFDIKPELNLDIKPQFNFNFGADGVDISFGGDGDNETINNITNKNNIQNIVNNTTNTNNTTNNINKTVERIEDKLTCDPCEKLEDIKKKLDYQPVYLSNSTGEFQSITRDNLFNIGYLEIDITQLPNTNKIVFGGNADNTMYTGWLVWRMNGYNFEKIQVSTEKSVYFAPKWANGFSICCTHNSRANCYYYIEKKD